MTASGIRCAQTIKNNGSRKSDTEGTVYCQNISSIWWDIDKRYEAGAGYTTTIL
jgi:hypothetical protein